MLHFSLPMIPAQISFWIINASDLFFVREMCDGLDGHSGDAWSGLLSTGYFLPTILTTLGLIFYDAWQLSAVTEEEGRARFFTQIFHTYSSVLFCCAAGIIWLCRPVMHVMKSNYYYAWHFVPFLVLASTCSCFNQFMNSVYVVNKKSQRSMVTMMAGAISNCLMNYFFIKWWGPVGATYASFLGLGLVFTLRAMDAHGMIGMHVHPGRVLVNAAALVFELSCCWPRRRCTASGRASLPPSSSCTTSPVSGPWPASCCLKFWAAGARPLWLSWTAGQPKSKNGSISALSGGFRAARRGAFP